MDTNDNKYPSGEFKFEDGGLWKRFVVKLRTMIASPCHRVPMGSILNIKLRGKVCLFVVISFYLFLVVHMFVYVAHFGILFRGYSIFIAWKCNEVYNN